MRRLSPAGQKTIAELASRHGFSEEAVMSMLDSILQGNGCTAQFSHPEFGGCGQWMRGGMTVLTDMFNQGLKTRVGALCAELSDLASSRPELARRSDVRPRAQPQQQQAAIMGGSPLQAGASGPGQQQADGSPAGRFTPPDAGNPAQAGEDVFAKIERLAALRARGFVSEEEFEAKKAELLARL